MLARLTITTRTLLRRLTRAGALTLVIAGAISAGTTTNAADSDVTQATPVLKGTPMDHADVLSLMNEMKQAYSRVNDYTATFVKRERVKGRLRPREVMSIKFAAPFKIYTRWTQGKHEGQELIYAQGWNGGKIRAHAGSFPDITVDLDPEGSLATRGQRHPITDFGLGIMIDLLARDVMLAGARPQDTVTYLDLGTSKIAGATVRCIEATTPPARWSPYYAHKARICISTQTHMPVRVLIWDRDDHLLEDYTYKKIRLNVGLTDLDFSPDNPEYGF